MCQGETLAGNPCRNHGEPFCWRHVPVGRPPDISTAAATGDRLVTLEAMRRRLALALDEASHSVVAQLTSQMSAVLLQIEDAKPAGKATLTDALAERRAFRKRRAVDDGGAGRVTPSS